MATTAKKNVLVAHVPYRLRGGEDQHIEILISIYRSLGLHPILFPTNRDPLSYSAIEMAQSLLWSSLPREPTNLSLVHLHNIYPILGPAFLRAISRLSIPLIWTIHNHRLYCTNGVSLYRGARCDVCKKSPSLTRPILKNCNSDLKKSTYYAVAINQIRHAVLDRISKFVALSPYIARELVEVGIDESRIIVLPNPVFEEGLGNSLRARDPTRRRKITYAGRLSPEKGVSIFPELARLLPEYELEVFGTGPLYGELQRQAQTIPNLILRGSVSRAVVLDALRDTDAAVLPSICNEICPTFAVEALAQGIPVYLANNPSMEWFIREFGATGVPSVSAVTFAHAIRRQPAGSIDPEAKRRVCATFSITGYGARLQSLLDSLNV